MSKWIGVEYQLPDIYDDVLFWDGDKVFQGYLDCDGQGNNLFEYANESSLWANESVTHWMPLPEPPKEEA